MKGPLAGGGADRCAGRATRDCGDMYRKGELEAGARQPYFQSCYLCPHLLNY